MHLRRHAFKWIRFRGAAAGLLAKLLDFLHMVAAGHSLAQPGRHRKTQQGATTHGTAGGSRASTVLSRRCNGSTPHSTCAPLEATASLFQHLHLQTMTSKVKEQHSAPQGVLPTNGPAVTRAVSC